MKYFFTSILISLSIQMFPLNSVNVVNSKDNSKLNDVQITIYTKLTLEEIDSPETCVEKLSEEIQLIKKNEHTSDLFEVCNKIRNQFYEQKQRQEQEAIAKKIKDVWNFKIVLSLSETSGNFNYSFRKSEFTANRKFKFHKLSLTLLNQDNRYAHIHHNKKFFKINDSIEFQDSSYGTTLGLELLEDEGRDIKSSIDVIATIGKNFLGRFTHFKLDRTLKLSLGAGHRSRKNTNPLLDVEDNILLSNLFYIDNLSKYVSFSLDLKALYETTSEEHENTSLMSFNFNAGKNRTISVNFKRLYDSNPNPGREKSDRTTSLSFTQKF